MSLERNLVAGAALVAALAACQAQEGVGYLGEPVARLSGTVVDARADPTAPLPSDPEVTLLWTTGDDDAGDAIEFERTRVVAGFPAHFALDVLALPDAEALAPHGFTFGLLLVESAADHGLAGVPLGIARHHVLMYVSDPPPELEPHAADRLGLPLGPGLHLMQVVHESPDPAEEDDGIDRLQPAPDGATDDVVIELLDPEALEVPNIW